MDTLSGITAAVNIIFSYITQYELTESNEDRIRKAGSISAGLEVLSAVTGCEHIWTRYLKPDGTMYSGVCWNNKKPAVN